MKLNIEDYNLNLVCTKLDIRITDSNEEEFTVYYALKRADDYIAEEGNKQFPIEYIGLFKPPYDLPVINQLLQSWGVVAISQNTE